MNGYLLGIHGLFPEVHQSAVMTDMGMGQKQSVQKHSTLVFIQFVQGIELGRQIGRSFYHVLPALTSVDQPKGHDHSPGGFLRAERCTAGARATDLGRTGILSGAQNDQFHF